MGVGLFWIFGGVAGEGYEEQAEGFPADQIAELEDADFALGDLLLVLDGCEEVSTTLGLPIVHKAELFIRTNRWNLKVAAEGGFRWVSLGLRKTTRGNKFCDLGHWWNCEWWK